MQTYRSLFSPSGCLTAKTFSRYLDGDLRPAEKALVDEHLRQCLICSDALEGYKRHRNTTLIKNDLEFLSGKVRKRFSSHPVINRNFFPGVIVITLFVFLIILFIIYYLIKFLLANPPS